MFIILADFLEVELGLSSPFLASLVNWERDTPRLFRRMAQVLDLRRTLLVQVEFSDMLVPTYSITPLNAPGYGPKQPAEKWRLFVEVGRGVLGSDNVTFTGSAPAVYTSKEVERANRAVEVATKVLDEAGRLTYPVVISVRTYPSGWSIGYEPVPTKLHRGVSVSVNSDFTKVEIILPPH